MAESPGLESRGSVDRWRLALEESLTFQSQLDRLETEILTQRQELRDLQVMNNDAHLSKDTAMVTLHDHPL